jgi:hypothetical protein
MTKRDFNPDQTPGWFWDLIARAAGDHAEACVVATTAEAIRWVDVVDVKQKGHGWEMQRHR